MRTLRQRRKSPARWCIECSVALRGRQSSRVSRMLSNINDKVIDMSKHERSNKETKKPPQHTAKEKKAAKQAKKHAGDHIPLIVKKP